MRRLALLSMDVEDWYHLEYFRGQSVNRTTSMLDGTERFSDLLASECVPATFFTLSEVARQYPALVHRLASAGHEIASHGSDHRHLSELSVGQFVADLRRSKAELEEITGRPVQGYRAPCFSMTEEKLARVPELGFRYDSSWIRFGAHPLYGHMELTGWKEMRPGVYRDPESSFLEFEIPTVKIGSWRLPVAGGAYFRFLPWPMLSGLIRRFVRQSSTYVLYIHPFECSLVGQAPYPPGTARGTRLRFDFGRQQTLGRIARVVSELRALNFEFKTFSQAADELS